MNIYKPPKQKSYSFLKKKNPIPIISYKINFQSSSKINKINAQNKYNINKTPYKR